MACERNHSGTPGTRAGSDSIPIPAGADVTGSRLAPTQRIEIQRTVTNASSSSNADIRLCEFVAPNPSNSALVESDNSVEFLYEPSQFYETLIQCIRSAHHRLALSALYFGSGEHERVLADELRCALEAHPELQVTIITDYWRSLRKNESSVAMLYDALGKYADRMQICLYEMPSTRIAGRVLPTPGDEMIGVYHCKFCLSDENVLITGANLSREYFVNRQDRYMIVRGNSSLSSFISAFIATVTPHCHRVGPGGSILEPLVRTGDKGSGCMQCTSGCNQCLTGSMNPSVSDAVLRSQLDSLVAPADSVGHIMRDLDSCIEGQSSPTFMYPVIQHSTIGLRREEEVVLDLLTSVPWRDIHLSSPYASYTPVMASALADASGAGADITLSSSSRTAHGFHGARGLKALVPEMHDMMLADFMDRVHTNHSSVSVGADTMAKYESDMNVTIATARKPTPITFRQYARPGWTFHAKGMWLSRHGALSNPATRNLSDCEPSFKPESTSQEQQVPGAVFYIGSSNGGYRSWTRDFELGFLVTTGSPRISQCLQRELASIERFAPQVARKEDVLARIEQIAWKRQLLGLLKTFL